MGVDPAREGVKALRVDFRARLVEVRADLHDPPVGDRDVCALDATRRDNRAASDDHSSASIWRNRPRTSIATATSPAVTDSAGLWLMPPLQRTNSIPISVISDI